MKALFAIYNRLKKYGIIQAVKDRLYRIANWMLNIRWHGGFINSDVTAFDIHWNGRIVRDWEKLGPRPIKSMTWFIPAFSEPHAGITNILYFIKYLVDKGIKINIVLLANWIGMRYCLGVLNNGNYEWVKKVRIFLGPDIKKLPYTDAGVATQCDTIYSLVKYNNTNSKFYFIQDDERLMYKDKYKKWLAWRTYTMGFPAFASADCLKQMYKDEFSGKCESYFAALNIERPYELRYKNHIKRLFFYARPEKEQDRNGFEFGLEGLKEIRKRHPEIEIVSAGSNMKFNDKGIGIRQMGNIPLKKMKEFYLSCDVGLHILLSKHTGVLPFEMMATSCAVMTNRQKYADRWLKDGENCVMFDLDAKSIADAFDRLWKFEDYYNYVIYNGWKIVSEMKPVEEEVARVASKMFGV